ncbi:unnamed protein product [Anisakis simplex]|uniref:Uncharacterized protein n=1 Tax=Anisakis simplex TaxID=6269 RepID=A0A3P6RYB4_ANISI|nr:unnamed protein product [Anisakis simplex]
MDAARLQSAALAALIAPTTKMFHYDEITSKSSALALDHKTTNLFEGWHFQNAMKIFCQPPVPVTINASSSPVVAPCSPEPCSVQTVPLASTTSAPTSTSVELQPITVPPTCVFGQYNPEESSPTSCRPIRSQRTPMREITTLDDPTELDDFMQQGEEGCIQDMKQFITQFSLRQTTVAMMTGVSQPYISKLLNETNGDGELIPQRRERYVFRPILIRILESFFAQTPFPDLNRRIEIATACNQALQIDKKGVGLMPKEVVSPQVVANWFANKRKELRRRSNDECAETSATNRSQPSSSDAGSTPSPSGSTSNTPLESDERAVSSASVPISVPALRPDGYGIGIETNLFHTLRASALMNAQSMYSMPHESSSAPPAVTAGIVDEITTNTESGSIQEGATPEQCLAEIQSQLDIVNNSVLALVNPYSNSIHTPVIKMEQTAE